MYMMYMAIYTQIANILSRPAYRALLDTGLEREARGLDSAIRPEKQWR